MHSLVISWACPQWCRCMDKTLRRCGLPLKWWRTAECDINNATIEPTPDYGKPGEASDVCVLPQATP